MTVVKPLFSRTFGGESVHIYPHGQRLRFTPSKPARIVLDGLDGAERTEEEQPQKTQAKTYTFLGCCQSNHAGNYKNSQMVADSRGQRDSRRA